MRQTLLSLCIAIFVAVLGLAWFTHGTGVIKNDISRNIFVPDQLTMPLQVKAAYNGTDILFRYRWPAKQPSIYHDMIRFEGGKWVRYGDSVPGPQPQGIYEDRLTMLVDDGSVPEFARYGGYVTVGDRMRFFQPEWFVGDARALRPSPAGGYYALFGDGPRGLRVFTREGFEVDLPTGISNALTVAWSPDERWTAVATANSVYVFPSRRPAERVVRIPLRVHDLAWGA